ncbi:hypothetical protein EVAR_44729_1 [Eumeta japonica]|uniref:Uncharacterized protein n=1 Tax=Eumeta variegata TaxID=151549 RepID=A0A4C1XHB8_EUMVA|nr:hypothetical protein EVAR_44729_1 [Eumeta japonica]
MPCRLSIGYVRVPTNVLRDLNHILTPLGSFRRILLGGENGYRPSDEVIRQYCRTTRGLCLLIRTDKSARRPCAPLSSAARRSHHVFIDQTPTKGITANRERRD